MYNDIKERNSLEQRILGRAEGITYILIYEKCKVRAKH